MTGEGSVDARPDVAYVSLGVVARASSLLEAQREASRCAASVVARLGELGVADADVRALAVSAWQYEEEPGSFVVPTFTVNNQVRARVRDVASVGVLLEGAAGAGATGVQGVVYDVGDRRALQARAREEAMRDAGEKAADLARLAGLRLGAPVSVSELVPAWREDAGVAGGPPMGMPPELEDYGAAGESAWDGVRVALRVVYSVG